MNRSVYAVCILTVVAGFGVSASADIHLSGNLSGAYTATNEDVYVESYVTLTGDVTIIVTNGRIIVNANVITGTGANGTQGGDGYYDASWSAQYPSAGGNGTAGFSLALQTVPGGSGGSPLDIFFETDTYLDGGSGGSGGSGAYGGIYICGDPDCIQYDSQPGASAGEGGDSGHLTIDSSGDLYISGEWWANGGAGGDGGGGGGVDPQVICQTQPGYMIAWPGKVGGLGGTAGSIELSASGDILQTADLTIKVNGGRGGNGGHGGDNGSYNGTGGNGGQGGGAGGIALIAQNIAADYSSYDLLLEAQSGLGGNGGHGGNGGWDYSGCDAWGGCDGNLPVIKGVGSIGGHSGYSGNPGEITMGVPASYDHRIYLPNLVAKARPASGYAEGGATGFGGVTFGVTGDCASCGGYAVPRTPFSGAAGYPGGSGGSIAFEGYSLEIPGCDLDVRGGRGSQGGVGGVGDCGDFDPFCRGEDGGDGGTGGSGGPGGSISYLVDYLDGTGGIARRCAGWGGIGGDGGYPNGGGGTGGTPGSIGSITDTSSSGPGAPARMACANPFPQSGDDGDTCTP